MRTLSFTIVLCFVFSVTMAQVEVGITKSNGEKRDFKSEELRQIKRSETVFLVPDKYKSVFENALKEIWKINEYKMLVHESGIKKPSVNEIICSVNIEKGKNAQRFNVFLEFRMDNYNSVVTIAEIPVFIKQSLKEKIVSLENEIQIAEKLYENPEIYNFSESILKANLKVINNRLAIGKAMWFSDEYVNNNYISYLSSASLHIPDYCLLKPNMITGEMNEVDKSKLLKRYLHDVKIIQDHNNFDRFLLLYSQTGNDSFIAIYDRTNDQIIYQDVKNNQYFLKRGDFKDIAKNI